MDVSTPSNVFRTLALRLLKCPSGEAAPDVFLPQRMRIKIITIDMSQKKKNKYLFANAALGF